MKVFGRARGGALVWDPAPARELWAWWDQQGRAMADAGVRGEGYGRFPAELSRRLRRVHPDLEWETAPGVHARNALVLSAGDRPELRPTTQRCVLAAPALDDGWEFHPARQPRPAQLGQRLTLAGGGTTDLSQAQAAVRQEERTGKVRVEVFHPGFASLSRGDRDQAAFLLLAWTLGEDGIGCWVGPVQTLTERPPGAVPAGELARVVAETVDAVDPGRWVLAHGQRRGRPALLATRPAVNQFTHPLLDQHVTVWFPFAAVASGLPDARELTRLREVEDRLVEVVGDRAVLVAYETFDGARTLHLYADHTDPSALQLIRSVASSQPGAQVAGEMDPGWRQRPSA